MKTRWRSLGLAVLAAAVLLTGCVAVVAGAAGAGAVAYTMGKLEARLDAPFDKVVPAANRALKQLQFADVSERQDALDAILRARTAEDKKVEVKISRVGPDSSNVKIRVGLIGDEARSLAILDKIKANL
jgi:hypothetical protein